MPAMSQPADPARVERGRAAIVSKGCYECHGYVGQGSIISGPALAGLQIPFEGLDAFVRAPSGQMPPYSKKILSEADLRDIQAFIASLPSPAKGR
jgi:ubiquinol-cytochrome c reductase cytochrome c subunit